MGKHRFIYSTFRIVAPEILFVTIFFLLLIYSLPFEITSLAFLMQAVVPKMYSFSRLCQYFAMISDIPQRYYVVNNSINANFPEYMRGIRTLNSIMNGNTACTCNRI